MCRAYQFNSLNKFGYQKWFYSTRNPKSFDVTLFHHTLLATCFQMSTSLPAEFTVKLLYTTNWNVQITSTHRGKLICSSKTLTQTHHQIIFFDSIWIIWRLRRLCVKRYLLSSLPFTTKIRALLILLVNMSDFYNNKKVYHWLVWETLNKIFSQPQYEPYLN